MAWQAVERPVKTDARLAKGFFEFSPSFLFNLLQQQEVECFITLSSCFISASIPPAATRARVASPSPVRRQRRSQGQEGLERCRDLLACWPCVPSASLRAEVLGDALDCAHLDEGGEEEEEGERS